MGKVKTFKLSMNLAHLCCFWWPWPNFTEVIEMWNWKLYIFCQQVPTQMTWNIEWLLNRWTRTCTCMQCDIVIVIELKYFHYGRKLDGGVFSDSIKSRSFKLCLSSALPVYTSWILMTLTFSRSSSTANVKLELKLNYFGNFLDDWVPTL